MLPADVLPAEGARYTASLLLVPGLWAGPPAWRGFASFLAHRGWECHLLDVRAVAGGVEARAAAVAEYAAALDVRPVLLAHDAGVWTALAAARRGGVAALVLVAPLLPGGAVVRALAFSRHLLPPLLLGRPVPPPTGRGAGLLWGELDAAARARLAQTMAADDVRTVRDVLWGRIAPAPAAGVPSLVVTGASDPLLPPAAAAALAARLQAEHQTLAATGHWPLAGPRWQAAVGLVHRWIVQRLGASLLELYPEAMAERDADDED